MRLTYGATDRMPGRSCLAVSTVVALLACPLFLSLTSQPAWSSGREKNTAGAADENFKTGMKRYKSCDFDGAIDSFLQSIYFSRNNYNPQANFWLGKAYKEKKEYFKGIDAFKKHIEQVVGPSPDSHLELGYLYMETGHYDEATIEFYNAMAQTFSNNPKAHNALGLLCERQGRWGEALDQFREALGDQPWTYLEAWLNMCECYMREQDFGSAYEQYQMLLKSTVKYSKEDQQDILNHMGVCLLTKGDHEGAMRKWRECLSLNPSNAPAHLNLGLMFDSENHITSAIGEYKQYVRLAPKEANITQIKGRLTLLEQKIAPPEPLSSAKPTPYMRQQAQDLEETKRKAFEELNTPAPAVENPF